MKKNKEALLEYLTTLPQTSLADLAYSTTARRIHEDLRVAYSGDSVESIIQQLRGDLSKPAAAQRGPQKKSLVWVFSGQGSQYPGMGSELFHTNTTFRNSIRSMQRICDAQGLPSFEKLISNKDIDVTQKTTVQVQLAVVAIELALADLWRSWGVKPDVVIGHSLGEYAALCVSGVLSVNDVLYLVGQRALLTQERCSEGAYAMLAVVAPAQALEEYLRRPEYQSCCISCYNSPSATVVSGPVSELQALEQSMRAAGTVCTLIRVPYGFHSPQLDPILDDFERLAQTVRFQAPKIPIVSTVTGSIVRESGFITPQYLARHAREPVEFYKALAACRVEGVADGHTIWVELGPDSVCGSMIKATLGAMNVHGSIKSRESNWKTVSTTAAALYTAGSSFSWCDFHHEYTGSLRLLDLPKYAFDTKNFWRVYKEDPVSQVESAVAKPATTKISSSLHIVQEQVVTTDKASFKFETSLADPELYEAIRGHQVDELPLCPAGIFCDIALTAAKYVHSKVDKTEGSLKHLQITNLELHHPVVASGDPKQILQISAKRETKTGHQVKITFHLQDGSATQEIGGCQVNTYTSQEWANDWSKTSFFVKSRMDSLVESVKAGRGDHLRRSVIYKLFASLVNYDPKYQAIEEMFWDEQSNDAVANVSLKPYNGHGQFECLPYWTDPLVHLAGFVLNVNLTSASDDVWLSGGVARMQLHEELSAETRYVSYVRSHAPDEHGVSLSDVYVFSEKGLVGFCSLVFQKMPRIVLHRLLHKHDLRGPAKVSASTHAVSAPEIGKEVTDNRQSPATAPPQASIAVENNVADRLITIIAEETGVDLHDMVPTADFASMGVDSLMGITIIDRVQKELDVQLEASFFQENLTVADAQRALGYDDADSESDQAANAGSEDDSPSGGWTPISPPESDIEEILVTPNKLSEAIQIATEAPLMPPAEVVTSPAVVEITPPTTPPPTEYKSNVVLIHGRKKSNKTPLFLITDGAGSATAYIHLPRFASGMPLYAVESPFVRCPLEYNFSVEETAKMYIAAIKKIQPEGPYMLGGWSAGGAHAFEVSRQLLEAGDKIKRLVIIDMKIPKPMPEGLEVTMDFLDKVGLTTGINRAGPALAGMSERLKQHLASTIKSLMFYTAREMDPSRRPEKSYIIWAEYGLAEIIGDAAFKDVAEMMGLKEDVDGNPMEDDTGLASWFYSRRDNFGPNGWDKLLGNVVCRSMKADHFSMVTPPAVSPLSSQHNLLITNMF